MHFMVIYLHIAAAEFTVQYMLTYITYILQSTDGHLFPPHEI